MTTIDPNEDFAPMVESITDALEPLGFEAVVMCADGSEPAASYRVDDLGWLDVTVTWRPDDDA